MDSPSDNEVIRRGMEVLTEAGLDGDPWNFLDFSRAITDVMKEWPREKKDQDWVWPFARRLHELDDNFSEIVEADPMILYQPQHEVSLAFHKSPAFIRYYRAGNRTSKTQSAYAEHYYLATNSHPWRKFPHAPTASFIVGINFTKYAPKVFASKFVKGEPENPLSPMFPEGGKWLWRYDDRKQIIYLCCPDCAEAGRAGQCTHLKSTITLFSDSEGADVLMGGQYNIGHFDEHIRAMFYDEGVERLKTMPHSSLLVSGTPLLGKTSWEHQKLTVLYNKGPTENRLPGTDIPMVSLHTIDQYAAGLVARERIDASRLNMDPLEQEARIWGKPGALAKHSVFDRFAMHEMEDAVRPPDFRGYLQLEGEEIKAIEHSQGMLRVWERPKADGQYVIGSDIAAGLTHADPSCSVVIEIPSLRQVAQLHGAINPRDHANETAKLGRWYNWAKLVPERSGLGVAMIQELRRIGYWNIFVDVTDPSQVVFALDPVLGIDTNIRTKNLMVSALAQAVKERQVTVYCADTMEEMRAFGQETTDLGHVRMRGEGGTDDDRVMALVFAVYVAVSFSIVNVGLLRKQREEDPLWREVHREIEAGQRTWRQKAFSGDGH